MTSKNRQEEKHRREELMYPSNQYIGRPMDNIDDEPPSFVFERLDAEVELPPAQKLSAFRKPIARFAIYLIFLSSIFTLILYLDAPYREKQLDRDRRDAESVVLLGGGSFTGTISRKVSYVSTNKDEYHVIRRRNVTSNLIPYRYIMFSGSNDRYYISRWLRFFLTDDELKNALAVTIEYDVRPKTRDLMFGKQYRYFSVTALTVDGKSYYSPTTTFGMKDSVILFSILSLLAVASIFAWRNKRKN